MILWYMKLYRRFFEYIDRNSKYIGDFPNISTATRNISAIFKIYRLTDKARQSTQKKEAAFTAAPYILEEQM
ncbi:hypothetical protein AAHB49_29955 [Bacillus cereus]